MTTVYVMIHSVLMFILDHAAPDIYIDFKALRDKCIRCSLVFLSLGQQLFLLFNGNGMAFRRCSWIGFDLLCCYLLNFSVIIDVCVGVKPKVNIDMVL